MLQLYLLSYYLKIISNFANSYEIYLCYLKHHNSEKFVIKVVKRAILAYSLIIFSLATDYICHNRK